MKPTIKEINLSGIIAAILILLISQIDLCSQWMPTYGPGGGRITSLLNYNNKIYAGTADGQIYVSTNNTDTWTNSSYNLQRDYYDVKCLSGTTSGIYALIYGNIYFLPINGSTWTSIQTGIQNIYSLTSDGNNLIIGTQNGKIYISSDGGSSWIDRSTGISPNAYISCFTIKNNYIFAGSSSKIYRSSNYGMQWENIGGSFTWTRVIAFKGDTLYTDFNGNLNYSTDFGNTWNYLSIGNQGDNWVYSIATYGSTIAAGMFYGVYISHDNGLTWNLNTMGTAQSMQVENLMFSGSRLISGSNAGIYKSDDLGNNWQPNMYGLTSLRVNRLLKCGKDIYAHNWGNGRNISISTNNGLSWRPTGSNIFIPYTEQLLSVNNNVVFAGTLDGVYKTTDKGNNWYKKSSGLDSNEVIYAIEYNNNNGKIYAGTQNHGLFVSSDLGETWIKASGTILTQYIRSITFKGNDIFVGTPMGILYSNDNGITWQQRNNGLDAAFIVKVQAYRGKVFAITEVEKLFASTNDGLSWSEVTNGLPQFRYPLTFYGRYIFMGSSDGVFMSTNLGDTWQGVNSGFPSAQYEVYRVLVKDYSIYAATALSGVWKRPLQEVLPSYTISGQVRYKNNNQPVNSGKVRALKYDEESGNIVTVDSAIIQQGGFYLLPHVPGDSLFIMSYPNDEFDYAPTYYPSSIDWREATQVYPAGNMSNVDISVYKLYNNSNPFSVSGAVYKNGNISIGISDACIYVKSGNEFKNFGISNENGLYNIGSLAPGTYDVTCYRIGYNSVSKPVTITNSNMQSVNFNLTGYLIGINPPNPVPGIYSLKQNFPNPFNPATKIYFSIPFSGFVKLVIYDMLGREITVLANELLQAGLHNYKWDGTNYPSGVYFYKIEVQDASSGTSLVFSETKKMVLIK